MARGGPWLPPVVAVAQVRLEARHGDAETRCRELNVWSNRLTEPIGRGFSARAVRRRAVAAPTALERRGVCLESPDTSALQEAAAVRDLREQRIAICRFPRRSAEISRRRCPAADAAGCRER